MARNNAGLSFDLFFEMQLHLRKGVIEVVFYIQTWPSETRWR